MSTFKNDNQMSTMGFAAIAVAATTITAAVYSSSISKNNLLTSSQKCSILVFPDTSSGLKRNAITVLYDRPEMSQLQFLKNIVAKQISGGDQIRTIRLFVQTTKKEIRTDSDWKSILCSKEKYLALKEIVLISTVNGNDLSNEAMTSKPLQHFSYTKNVRNLPVLGQKLVYKGNSALPLRNAYHNLFKNNDDQYMTTKTVLINRPPVSDEGALERYGIDYIPTKEYGVVNTIDQNLISELQNRQVDFPKMFTQERERALQDYGGMGLFTSSTTDESWETGHGVLPKFFNAFRIKNYYPIILDKTESFIRQWAKLGNNGTVENADDWLTCMTADAVVKAAMDYDMNNVERKGSDQELHPFIKSFRYCVAHIVERTSPRDENEYIKQKKISEEMINEIVEQTRNGKIGGPLSFITGMLDAKASTNGEHVKFADFYGHCINLMVAGHETTAATLGFCLAEIARKPDVLAKALKEIEDVLGDRSAPTYEDVQKLNYIDACFKETLRLNPPVQRLRREAAHDTIVLDDYLVRKGQSIEILVAGMHRDPEQWDQGIFGDTDVFNPDRHLPGAPPRHPNAMVPFGFGVRGCIGMQFALLEAKAFLCMALNFFNIQTPDGFEPVPHLGHGAAPTCMNLSFNISHREGGPLSRVDLFVDNTSDLQ